MLALTTLTLTSFFFPLLGPEAGITTLNLTPAHREAYAGITPGTHTGGIPGYNTWDTRTGRHTRGYHHCYTHTGRHTGVITTVIHPGRHTRVNISCYTLWEAYPGYIHYYTPWEAYPACTPLLYPPGEAYPACTPLYTPWEAYPGIYTLRYTLVVHPVIHPWYTLVVHPVYASLLTVCR